MRFPEHHQGYKQPTRRSRPRTCDYQDKQERINLVPIFLKDVENKPSLMQDDKLHPIKEAQAILLENVWPEIKKLLGRPSR